MHRSPVVIGHRKRSIAGISVIELLIVVAVLSILWSIIFPLFCRVRDYSNRARCAANLRQFAAAFSLYSEDWSGYWPCPGGLVGDRSYWSQSGFGGINAYIKQQGLKSVWCCPLLMEWSGKYPPRSYSMNSYLRTPCDVEYPSCLGFLSGVSIARVTQPRETILLFEGIPLTNGWHDKLDYIYRCANWTRVRGYTPKIANTIEPGKPWHSRLNNYLYCDGHIAARRPGTRTTAELSTYSEMRQWYVDKRYYEATFTRCWARFVPRD